MTWTSVAISRHGVFSRAALLPCPAVAATASGPWQWEVQWCEEIFLETPGQFGGHLMGNKFNHLLSGHAVVLK